jgi:hypothetical protein
MDMTKTGPRKTTAGSKMSSGGKDAKDYTLTTQSRIIPKWYARESQTERH